jgi:AraC-like DNA-binding protein
MASRKKPSMQFRYYDPPQKERCLALLGQSWVREYGNGIDYLHFHNLMEIGYCRQGNGILVLNDRCLPYESGMISVIPRNYPHSTNSEVGTTSSWEYLFLDPEEMLREVYPDSDYNRSQLLEIVQRDAIFGKQGRFPQLTSITIAIMEEMRYKRDYYIEAVDNLLKSLIFEIARIIGSRDSSEVKHVFTVNREGVAAIRPALDYVGVKYAEQMKIEKLAELCCMSETHFRRLFAEYMGMTPVDYVNMVRIRMACELMKKTNDSMSDISLHCGFTTASTFNRNFRKLIGVTPYQWKKNPENYESALLKFHITAAPGW